MKKAIALAMLLTVLSACGLGGIETIDFRVILVDPAPHLGNTTKVLPCDHPGPPYYSETNRWSCTNTGSIPIGTVCQATNRTTGGDLRYYRINCNGVVGWVISDFIASVPND